MVASSGTFTPTNPQKYMGDPTKVTYKSTFELAMMSKFDSQQSILGWLANGVPSSHAHLREGIPFENPYTRRWDVFYPDFFVVVMNAKNKQHVEVIEVKSLIDLPQAMSGTTGATNQAIEEEQVLNAAKYSEAIRWCKSRGYKFRVIDQEMTFNFIY